MEKVINVLLSFNGNFANLIYKGIKQYEVRKSQISRMTFDSLLFIYETKPVGKITGYFKTDMKRKISPKKALSLYDFDDLTNAYVQKICESYLQIFVIKVVDPIKLSVPIDPSDVPCFNRVPQSFRYLTEEEMEEIKRFNDIDEL